MVHHVDSVAGEGLGWLSRRGRGVARSSAVDGSVALEVGWGAGRSYTRVELGGDVGGVSGLTWGGCDGGKGAVGRC